MRVRIRDVVAPVFWPVHRAIARGTVQELVAKAGAAAANPAIFPLSLFCSCCATPPATRWCCARSAARCAPVCMRRSSGPLGRWGWQSSSAAPSAPWSVLICHRAEDPLFWHRRPRQAEKHQGAIWSHRPGLVRGAGPVRRPRGGAQCGAERVPRRQLYPGIQKLQPAGIGAQLGQPLCAGTAPRQAGAPLHLPRPAARLAGRTLFGGCRPPGTDQPHGVPHEYLGEAVGCGTAVFGNIQLQTLTTEQCQSFDRVYHGVDWGWYPDPWATTLCITMPPAAPW